MLGHLPFSESTAVTEAAAGARVQGTRTSGEQMEFCPTSQGNPSLAKHSWEDTVVHEAQDGPQEQVRGSETKRNRFPDCGGLLILAFFPKSPSDPLFACQLHSLSMLCG